jgi:hypothetical protein
MVADLKPTLSALLVNNNMSFHWDNELKHWWLVKEIPAGYRSQSKFFNAADLVTAKKDAYIYLKLLSKDTHPLR